VSDQSIASRLFDATYAENELEEALSNAGINFEKLGWDYYDCSLEIYGVEPICRLSVDAQKVIHAAGFATVYVNHTDEWETHYTFPSGEFVEQKGWRVSYPHKRKDASDKTILLERPVESWPKEWLETGYCKVVT
jgi:hypothetical protein